MNVHAGKGRLHSTQNVAVVKRRQSARQPALNADLSCAKPPRFDGLFGNLLWIQKVSVGFTRATTESAELASDKTNVSEIDVAVDDIRHDVAGEFAAE